jgi:hypothetical protein
LVVFVVGGVTHGELEAIAGLSRELGCDIYVGSTEVLSPSRMVELIFAAADAADCQTSPPGSPPGLEHDVRNHLRRCAKM